MKKEKFCNIIKNMSGHEVIPVNLTDDKDKELVEQLHKAGKKTIEIIERNPIISKRPNEVGNKIERKVEQAFSILASQGYSIQTPINQKGNKQTAGYPDLLIFDRYSRPTYLECKTYSANTFSTSMRSFYFSSGDKITYDARHIVISFQINEIDERKYSANEYRLIDIAELECNLKLEWNANNQKLYKLRNL